MLRFVSLLLLFINISFATLIVSEQNQELTTFNIPYFYDNNRSLSIEDISKLDFKQEVPSRFGFGHITGNSWFKFTIKNETQNPKVVLRFAEIWYEEFNLYHNKNSIWQKREAGLFVPLAQRDKEDSYPTFYLDIPIGETQTYYIEAFSKLTHIGAFSLLSYKLFASYEPITHLFLYMFYFGGLLMVVLLHSFLFIMLKERIFAYYVGYAISTGILVFVMTGVCLYFDLAPYYYQLQIIVPLMTIFLILFSMQFLNIKKKLPTEYKLLKVVNFVLLFLTVVLLFELNPWLKIVNHGVTIALIILLYSALKIWLRGDTDAKIYLIIMVTYVVGLVLVSSIFTGDLENTPFNRYSFLFTSYFELGFFALVLTKRITKTKELEEAQSLLKEQANRDSLTKLYNRRYFSEIADQNLKIAKRYEQELSLFMIDIDNFKVINDTYGHQAGDNVLVDISEIFTSLARESDIVTRYGGEEFLILLPQTSLQESVEIAQRVRTEVESMVIKLDNDKELRITISIGVSEFLKDIDNSIDNIIKRADDFLYRAKKNGKNQVVFSEELI